MQIIRGDDYQSWIYANSRDLIVVDPWFTKKQVFPKINWLLNRESTQEAYLIKNKLIEKVTHIIITAHFSDHLDIDSLKMFKNTIPIYTTHEASKVLKKEGFTNVNLVKNDDEYDVWEVAELTGFAREWIRRNCKKGNFPEPTRIVRRDSAYHYWNKDLILRWCKVRLKLLLLSADRYLQKELNPTYYEGYKYGYKRSFNTPKIQKVWERFNPLKSQPFSSMHWVGQLNYNNRLSHKKVMEEFKNPTDFDPVASKKITDQWGRWIKKYDPELQLYDLRHSWARRSIVQGVPSGLAAKCLGHSISVFEKTYLSSTTEKDMADYQANN